MGIDILFSRKLIYITLLMKLIKVKIFSMISMEIIEKIKEKEYPIQIVLLDFLLFNGFVGISYVKLQEILQINILLVTNYLVTCKMSYKKDKKVTNI